MLEYLENIFGSVSNNELLIVAIIVIAILFFTWAPRAGELVADVVSGEDPIDPSQQ